MTELIMALLLVSNLMQSITLYIHFKILKQFTNGKKTI